MRRHCNGQDYNLLRPTLTDGVDLDLRNDPAPEGWFRGDAWRPCNCGLVFDDVNTSTVFPHHRW